MAPRIFTTARLGTVSSSARTRLAQALRHQGAPFSRDALTLWQSLPSYFRMSAAFQEVSYLGAFLVHMYRGCDRAVVQYKSLYGAYYMFIPDTTSSSYGDITY
ncbi:hypothetical protein PCH_Pc21g08450 [Penicillium rubens Wisconsin 54-1255]|uniref:Uncharacterized protein n=1 Tax=Penicillium rubens (strain ATCC 28089 / DSM 1075 / NRRL 1951 / Wisconsin 54-1255) TaxID=500485 RepID=B6HLY7_PENRW|nr:hypothetical protein PCH_Pc21g08450 [Penicillium rubens Wisconsin 54-1255]